MSMPCWKHSVAGLPSTSSYCLQQQQHCQYHIIDTDFVCSFTVALNLSAFSPLHSVLWRCWLGGRKDKKTEWWPVGCWRGYLSGARCRLPSWCHCHSQSLDSVKARLVLPFWYQPTWVVLEKGPLNGCVCVEFKTCNFCSLFASHCSRLWSFVPPLHSGIAPHWTTNLNILAKLKLNFS